MRGKVKWFHNLKGYGFIETEFGDAIVHYSGINKEGFKYLAEGDIVEFDLILTTKGYRAENVKKLP